MNMNIQETNERRMMMMMMTKRQREEEEEVKQLRTLMSLPPANWEALQQAVRVNVAKAMEDFYRRHARGIRKLELMIERELLPKLRGIPPDGKASKETRRTVRLVKRLLYRVERLRPVVMVRLPVQDNSSYKQPVRMSGSTSDLRYKNRRRAARMSSSSGQPRRPGKPWFPQKCHNTIGHTQLRPSDPRQRQNPCGGNMTFMESSPAMPLNQGLKNFPPGGRWAAPMFYD
ncbi:uncharacterized protein [Drosophila bipectinata]|uniref:uncharacterized protein n=1 Tax=Drosophila bipectinata TaxID=42026 RepID=UPI001C8AE49B|nr:uncharacterized protein LOC108129029 [Drosophila bipectinata]